MRGEYTRVHAPLTPTLSPKEREKKQLSPTPLSITVIAIFFLTPNLLGVIIIQI
jgi:hypothetical protein